MYRKNSILHTVLDPHNHKLTTLFSKYVLGQMKPLDIRNILASHIIPFIDKEYLSSSDFISEVEASDFINQEFAKKNPRLRWPFAAPAPRRDRQRTRCCFPQTGRPPKAGSGVSHGTDTRACVTLLLFAGPATGSCADPFALLCVQRRAGTRARALYGAFGDVGKALNVRHTPIVAQQAQTEFITLWALQIVDERRIRPNPALQMTERSLYVRWLFRHRRS